ncbi:hypothetical protein ACOMHN_015633 [Nucella lapillus]
MEKRKIQCRHGTEQPCSHRGGIDEGVSVALLVTCGVISFSPGVMESGGRHTSKGRSRTREERRSFSESLADGTSKFFSSVIAKKNGLFSDISKQIETTFSGSRDSEGGGRRSSRDETPPGTPPPRPPPPRKPPKVQEMREKEKIIKRMSSMPAYPRSDSMSSGGSTSSRHSDRQLSMNGMNISFDEPLYSRHDDVAVAAPSSESRGGESLADAAQFFSETQFKSDIDESTARMMEAMNLSDPGKTRPETEEEEEEDEGSAEATSSPASDTGSSIQSERFVTRPQPPPKPDPTPAPKPDVATTTPTTNTTTTTTTTDPNSKPRAPKFTITKRRSSTVDEMLFDDYVEPEDGPADTVFTSENLPQDLMSFDPESPAASGSAKASPHPSQSSVDSVEASEGFTSNTNPLYASTSVESSDVEYGGTSVHRSASVGSDKSWSSTYSLDSQPDEVTLECMEFMKSFVDKVFSLQ